MEGSSKCSTCDFLEANPPIFKCKQTLVNLDSTNINRLHLCIWYKEKVISIAEARPLEKVNEINDLERVKEFSQAMYQKWQKGRQQYGKEMRFDPLEEAMMECVDCANYMLEAYFRIKKLKE